MGGEKRDSSSIQSRRTVEPPAVGAEGLYVQRVCVLLASRALCARSQPVSNKQRARCVPGTTNTHTHTLGICNVIREGISSLKVNKIGHTTLGEAGHQ